MERHQSDCTHGGLRHHKGPLLGADLKTMLEKFVHLYLRERSTDGKGKVLTCCLRQPAARPGGSGPAGLSSGSSCLPNDQNRFSLGNPGLVTGPKFSLTSSPWQDHCRCYKSPLLARSLTLLGSPQTGPPGHPISLGAPSTAAVWDADMPVSAPVTATVSTVRAGAPSLLPVTQALRPSEHGTCPLSAATWGCQAGGACEAEDSGPDEMSLREVTIKMSQNHDATTWVTLEDTELSDISLCDPHT